MPVDHVRAKEIFLDAVELPPEERERLVQERCGDDDQLGAHVRRLLIAHGSGDRLDGQSDEARTADLAVTVNRRLPTVDPGTMIGPYEVVRMLGEGGFGVVYLAEQKRPIRRRVAIKIIRLGMDTQHVIARFEQERQALALMDHPGIATVLDAGATEAGRPYFVMEYVDGPAITSYCDRARLAVEDRVALFREVCQAVQHAHQKGIVHRDLKPNNVLIADIDGRPMPKVIDFGIAKATESKITDRTLVTAHHQIIGTPECMPPEQVAPGEIDVDTRADVYGLGVLLYRLLTGVGPFDEQRLREIDIVELVRMIREDDPPRPSSRVRQLGDALEVVSAQRRTTVERLPRALAGDLDWIVMRSIEKQRARRYETVAEFSNDLGRYLDDEPVTAGPPGARYRVGKFVRRHRAALAGLAVVALALVIGAAASVMFALREAEQRRLAEEAGRELQIVVDFQDEMLSSIEPRQLGTSLVRELRHRVREQRSADGATEETIARDLAALDELLGAVDEVDLARALITDNVLARAVDVIGRRFADDPAMEANLRLIVGRIQLGLFEVEAAEEQILVALARCRHALGEAHADTMAIRRELGRIYRFQKRQADESALRNESLALCRAEYGEDHALTWSALFGMAAMHLDYHEVDRAEVLARQVLDLRRRGLGAEHPDTLDAEYIVARVHLAHSRFSHVERVARRVLPVARRVLGDGASKTRRWLRLLAITAERQGQPEEATRLWEEVLAQSRRVDGDHHDRTLSLMANIAVFRERIGDLDGARRDWEELRETSVRLRGREYSRSLNTLRNLAAFHSRHGNLAEAEAMYGEYIDIHRRLYGDQHRDTLGARAMLAGVVLKQGRFDEAVTMQREVLEARQRTLGGNHPQTLQSHEMLDSAIEERDAAAAENVNGG
ncbi:MAG: protein kinase domain-containing protein [Planctomycetota bacterium]|jgi:serine/threonine protein kinase/tetratricopeptide (TPR) repeat protein